MEAFTMSQQQDDNEDDGSSLHSVVDMEESEQLSDDGDDVFRARRGARRGAPRAAVQSSVPETASDTGEPYMDSLFEQGEDYDMASEHTHSELDPSVFGRPGFDAAHYGVGITPRPLIFDSGCAIEWEEYNDLLCTDKEGICAPMRPARTMNINVPVGFMSKGAQKASDFVTPKNDSERRRVEATARLTGLMSAATSKGYANGNHAQLEQYKDKSNDEFEKEVRKMEPFGSYVYMVCDESDPDVKGYRGQMFMFGCEAIYDTEGKHIVCFRHWKFVMDKKHSDSYAWKKILKENELNSNAGRMNRSTSHQRNSKSMLNSKAARSMTSGEDISETGETLYLHVSNVSDLRTLYKTYAGTSADCTGAPPFDERWLPAGLCTHELYSDGDNDRGGLHPLGPEAALNSRRAPTEENGMSCPLTAGMVDLHGNLIMAHAEQMHPSKYFNDNGDFVPSQFVQEKGALKIMVNPYHTSLFDPDLPHPTCGSEEPDDCILKLFWEEQFMSNVLLVNSRKAARSRGVDVDDWENFRDDIYRAINQQMSERDGLSEELVRAIQQTKLLGKDSFDMTDDERKRARQVGQWCSYEARTLEPFQILKQVSSEIKNLYAFIRRWRFEQDTRHEEEMRRCREGCHTEADARSAQLNDHVRHTELRRSVIKLGLQKMQNAFESENHRKSIPSGWLAIWDSLQEEFKSAASESTKRQNKRKGSMIVDPSDSRASVGSAAIGQLFGTGYNNFAINSQGMFTELVMGLLNGEQGIKGPSTFITMAMHYAQYQVAQPMSFILAICGEGSTGKSERASLMMDTQLPGWWESGGGKSELADFNGMDPTCGRVIHLDEVTKDFTGDGESNEKIKEITMKNSCTRSRTVKRKGSNGDDKWETEVTFTLHYETYVITTNCGVCLQRGKSEPSDSRAPLFDRMITFPAPPVTNVTASSKDAVTCQHNQARSVKVAERRIQYRIICGLTWHVLLFIKHIPDLHPANSEWAHRIMEEMDDTLISSTPNIEKSTPRKQQLRNMTLMAICVQKEVVRKFFTVEGCLQHEDLQPRDGFLPPWSCSQLVDVVQRLAYSPADVFEAWSHSLDHSTSTSSIAFHVRQMVAMSHGVSMGEGCLHAGTPPPPPQSAGNAGGAVDGAASPQPRKAALYPGESPSDTPDHVELVNARKWAHEKVSGAMIAPVMSDAINLSFEDTERKHLELARSRELRCYALKTRKDSTHVDSPGDVLASLKQLLTTNTRRVVGEDQTYSDIAITKIGSLEEMETSQAVGCILPTLNDARCCGYEDSALLKWLQGLPYMPAVGGSRTTQLDRRMGSSHSNSQWSFVCIGDDEKEATAAQFNTMWRYIRPKTVSEGSGWTEATHCVTTSGGDMSNTQRYGLNVGLTHSNVRDMLWLLSTSKDTLIGKDCRSIFVDTGDVSAGDGTPGCTGPHGAMRQGSLPHVGSYMRTTPVLHSEALSGDGVRPYGAEQWDMTRPDPMRALQFVSQTPSEALTPELEVAVRRFQRLFQSGSLPACNPFSFGAVESGSMIRMNRGIMQVNSFAIISQMRLFMEISYFLAAHTETRNRLGISRSKMPSALLKSKSVCIMPMEVSRDVCGMVGAPLPQGGMHQHCSAPMQRMDVSGFDPDARGSASSDNAARGYTARRVPPATVDGEGSRDSRGRRDDVGAEDQLVRNLGFCFEMFPLWATITMTKKWTNDCDDHVHGIVSGNMELFQDEEDVLESLPKFTTKYCSFTSEGRDDSTDTFRSDDDVRHVPISVELPRCSRQRKMLPTIASLSTQTIMEVSEDYRRFMQGEVDDVSMRQELNLKLRSIGGIPGVRGNIWARSTWEMAMRNDMISRGQAHGGSDDRDLFHARDSDLDVQLRLYALLAKKNPMDEDIIGLIGERKGACHQKRGRSYTAEERDCVHKKKNTLQLEDDAHFLRRNREAREEKRRVPPPLGAIGTRLAMRDSPRSEGGSR